MLEEFFKCPPPDEENRLEAEFQDLEYELRRQAGDSGDSYVGQRLAKNLPGENEFCMRIDSPRKCLNNTNIPTIQVSEMNKVQLILILLICNLSIYQNTWNVHQKY